MAYIQALGPLGSVTQEILGVHLQTRKSRKETQARAVSNWQIELTVERTVHCQQQKRSSLTQSHTLLSLSACHQIVSQMQVIIQGGEGGGRSRERAGMGWGGGGWGGRTQIIQYTLHNNNKKLEHDSEAFSWGGFSLLF